MTTLDDLINEVHLNLLGWVLDQEQLTTLTADITSGATTAVVNDATQVSIGLVEMDEELVWISSVDPNTGTVSIVKRGMYGTTPAAHTTTALVRNAPRVPRHSIKRAINATVLSCYPDLFGVGTSTLSSSGVLVGYELPADVKEVLSIDYHEVGPSEWWSPVRRYEVNLSANTDEFPTGKAVNIFDPLVPGRVMQVEYRTVLNEMTNLSDDFSVTGLQESARECVVYGACARLVGYTEPARMSDQSAEARFMDTQSPGSALTTSRYFYQMHLQTKAEESRRLLDLYPTRPHFTR